MKFKCGDIVIRYTGGNKMTISNLTDLGWKCFWFVGSQLNERIFSENEIITIPEWKRILQAEERNEKLNQILK
jgi:hypothetical protein